MPFTAEAKNAQLEAILKKTAPSISAEYVTGGVAGTAEPPTSEAAASQRIIKVASAPNTGTLVIITELNGKSTVGESAGGLTVGQLYYVRKVSPTEIELANTKAQAESATAGEHIEFTAGIKTTTKIVSITEGTFKERVKTGFGTIANEKGEDSTAREPESTASQEISFLMYFSAASSGTIVGVSEKFAEVKKLANGDFLKVTKTTGEMTGA